MHFLSACAMCTHAKVTTVQFNIISTVALTYLFSETSVTFTVPLKDVTVTVEETVTLECELSKPNKAVKWFKNGTEIKPDKKRGIEPKMDKTKHTLTIPKSIVEDSAEYTVKLGKVETKGKLTVEGLSYQKSLSFPFIYFWSAITLVVDIHM